MSTHLSPASPDTFETDLRQLATVAPARVGAAALVEVGLADRYARIDSPLGPLFVAWNGRGVSEVTLAGDAAAFEEVFAARHGRTVTPGELPASLATRIGRRMAGDRRADIPLDLRGASEFEQAVWRKALEIPRGEVRPYGWIAAEIGRPKAVRAVGTALGHNPVPLVVPCHRVVRSDGTIGQYSLGGPRNKRTILAAEGIDPDEFEGLARRGIRFVGSDTTKIVCLPTCHNARRITPPHRVPFRSLGASAAVGYRPCRGCRPGSGASIAA
ncbi:MAG: methylated-DNA--[protein]-cysteine S-methyltransferase [Chloroflexota bacterium]